MSKLTRKPLDINTLIGEPGMHLKDIPNLSEWLLSYKPDYNTGELAEFLKNNGVVFTSLLPDHLSSELGNYLPPKDSMFLSLAPYINDLYTLYLESYRKHNHANLSVKPVSSLDIEVLTQWSKSIPSLHKHGKRTITRLALYHPDKKLILDTREKAFYAVKAEIQLGTKYDQGSLFTNLQIKQKDKPVSIAGEQSKTQLLHQVIELQGQAIEANYKQIKELKDELEQIKNLLNTRVQDLLRAVK